MISHHIDALYFDYQPVAGHLEDCPRHGTDVWDVTRHHWESFSGHKTEITIRCACHLCGFVAFDRADTDLSHEVTHADEVGYGSKPENVAGVWLHPGPRIWCRDERGPTAYLVTRSKELPRRPEDVIGKVGWTLGSRGGVRWGAGLGCTGHGTVLTASEQTWSSRRAAVAWVAENAASGAS